MTNSYSSTSASHRHQKFTSLKSPLHAFTLKSCHRRPGKSQGILLSVFSGTLYIISILWYPVYYQYSLVPCILSVFSGTLYIISILWYPVYLACKHRAPCNSGEYTKPYLMILCLKSPLHNDVDFQYSEQFSSYSGS